MDHTKCALSRSSRISLKERRDHCFLCQSPLYTTQDKGQFRTADDNILLVKASGGVPIKMVPYHKSLSASVNGTLPVDRLLDVMIPPARGCWLPVFVSYAAMPL